MSARKIAFGLAAAAALGTMVAGAAAGDLAVLRRAVDAGDPGALQGWLVEDAKAPTTTVPRASARPPSSRLEQDGAEGAATEMQVHTLALLYLVAPDPALKSRLLAAIDAAARTRSDLDRKTSAETLGVARETLRLSDVAVAPRKGGLVVGFAYAGAAPDTEISARWFREADEKSVEIGRSTARLEEPAGRAELGLDPAPATGTLRVELLDRDRVVAARGFVRTTAAPAPTVPAALPAARPPATASPPAPTTTAPPTPRVPATAAPAAPTTAAPSTRRRAEPPAASPAVAALPPRAAPAPLRVEIGDAVFAKALRDGQPTQTLTEMTTARRRLVLWLEATANQATTLGVRWRGEGGAALGESVLDLPAGKSKVAFWLATADQRATFPSGKLSVEVVQGGAALRTLSLNVRTAGLFEALQEGLDDLGSELDALIKGGLK